MKASVQIRQSSYIKAGVSFRKSWKFYEECFKVITDEKSENDIDPEYLHDVLFGIGVFSFVISLVPPAFTFFVEAIGFKGDRGKGFRLLKDCSERQSWTGFMSLFLLQVLYQFYFEDSSRAYKITETIRERFPSAIVPLFASGYTLRFMGEIDQAEANFVKLYDAADQLKQLRLSCLYELGSTAVKKSNWTKAIENINGYLKENPPEGYRCYAAYEIGVCYCFAKDYEKAKLHFKKSVEWVRKEYAFDVYASRKSKQFLDSKLKVLMSPFELIYFEAKEKYKIVKYEEALEILLKAKAIKGSLTPDDRAVYFLLYGELIRKKDIEKAQKKFERVTKERVRQETFAAPHAYVELAKIAMHHNKIEEAKKLLKIASDHKNYDFNAQLLRTITRLFDKIAGVNYGVEL
jgi:tetratricopeptide (TPR) repeat protein